MWYCVYPYSSSYELRKENQSSHYDKKYDMKREKVYGVKGTLIISKIAYKRSTAID